MTDDPAGEEMLHRIFEGLTRAGPGDATSVARALAGVAPDAVVLDAGCGTGGDLPHLMAVVPQGRVVAVDLIEPFIASIRASHPGVEAHVGDMLAPPGGPFDIVWSAGAAYLPGVRACLAAWRAHLAPGGRVAFSHLCWRTADPPEPARSFWAYEFPGMDDLAAHRSVIESCGYRILDGFWLPPEAWEAYYEPLAERLDALDPAMAIPLRKELMREIEIWRSHGDSFGYWLAVLALEPG